MEVSRFRGLKKMEAGGYAQISDCYVHICYICYCYCIAGHSLGTLVYPGLQIQHE